MNIERTRQLAMALTGAMLCGLLSTKGLASERLSATQMERLLVEWPPAGWQLNPPLSSAPFPPIVKEGEFSTTFYRVGDSASDSWSGSIKISDKITESGAIATLDQLPFCNPVTYMGIQARECGSMGRLLGRREIVFPHGRLFVEISITGPKPIDVPEIKIRTPR